MNTLNPEHGWRLIAGVALLASILAAPAATADVGETAPALVLTQLDGHTFDLKQQRGRVVVLNLWATWCVPCRAEMPMLDAFYKKYAPRGVLLFGASADDVHDRKDVVRAMGSFGFPAALLFEAKSNGFGAPPVLPISYVIDADGVIRARLMPGRAALTEAALAALVEPLLAGVKAPPNQPGSPVRVQQGLSATATPDSTALPERGSRRPSSRSAFRLLPGRRPATLSSTPARS